MFVYVFICGGHHDSDRIAVLVMVSKAESIELYLLVSSCILAKIKTSFLPSFPHMQRSSEVAFCTRDADKAHTVFDLISEHALITEHPPFFFFFK